MGCGSSREVATGVRAPLDHKMEHLSMDSLDTFFSRASEIIREVEDIRDKIIDDRDDVFEDTGACSYKEPDLQKALYGLLWKISADHKGKVNDAELEIIEHKPFIRFKSGTLSYDARRAIDSFCDYVSGIMDLHENVEALNEKSKSLVEGLESIANAPEEIKQKFEGNILAIPGALSKLAKNSNKVRKTIAVIPEILKNFSVIVADCKSVISIVKDHEKLAEVDKNWTLPHVIVWHSIEDVNLKYATVDEGKKKYNKKNSDRKKRKTGGTEHKDKKEKKEDKKEKKDDHKEKKEEYKEKKEEKADHHNAEAKHEVHAE